MPTLEQMNARLPGTLPGYLGIEIVQIDGGHVDARLPIRPELLAPNGFLHAARRRRAGGYRVWLRRGGEFTRRGARLHDDRAEDELPWHGS